MSKELPSMKQPLRRSLTTYRAGLLQAQAYRALRKQLTTWLTDYQLSVSEWALLGSVYDLKTKGLRLSKVAELLQVELPSATNLVNSLEAKGLVERRADAEDSRARCVIVTKRGNELVPVVEKALRTRFKEWLRDVDSGNLEQYLKVLEHLARHS